MAHQNQNIEDEPETPSNFNEAASDQPIDPDKLDATSSEKSDGLGTGWKKKPSVNELKEDLEFARQTRDDQVSNVEGWTHLRNATGAEAGNRSKLPGRSSVQPKLIRKHGEWRYPALTEPFLNSDRMYEVKPRTHEDKKAAVQNEMILNWQFDTKIDRVDFMDRYVRTIVDEGTCIVRVGWDRKTERVKARKIKYNYFPLEDDEEMLQVLSEATALFVDDEEAFEANNSIPDSLKAAVEYGLENQVAVFAEKSGYNFVTEDRVTVNQPDLKIVNVANIFIDPSCEGEWQNAQFMVYTYEATQSDMRKRSIFKNLDDVNWSANSVVAKAADPDHETGTDLPDSRTNTDKQKAMVHEYWGLYDIHDSGMMVPIVCTFIGDTIVQLEENPFPDRRPPFVVVPYMPILGSIYGESDASLLQDNQRILGAINRGMLDLMGRSANAQTGYAKGFLDPVNRRRFTSGEDFEYNPNADPSVAIRQMVYPEIPNSALQVSAIQSAEAESLSGVKSFEGGITGEAFGKVARGVTGALDAAGQREMSILRRVAEGMRLIGNKIIAMNGEFLEKKEIIRITNDEFIEIAREDLYGQFDLILGISTAQVDEAKSQDLGFMLQTMGPDMDPNLSKVILGQIADLKRMPDLAEQIRSFEPQPDPLVEKAKELEIAKLEMEIAVLEATALEKRAKAGQIDQDTEMDADGTKHDRDIEKQGAQSRGNRNLEVTKGILNSETNPNNIEAAVGFNELTERADGAPAKERDDQRKIDIARQALRAQQEAANAQQAPAEGEVPLGRPPGPDAGPFQPQ